MGAAVLLENHWPLIDENKLQSIKNLSEPDDEDDFFQELLGIFFERVPLLLAEIEANIGSSNALKLQRSAHALKGSAGNLGAIKLMKMAEILENIGSTGTIAGAASHIDELKSIYILTQREIESNWLATKS